MVSDENVQAYDDVAVAYERRFVDELTQKPDDRDRLDRFAASVDGVVLDVGCGPGQIGAYVRTHGRAVVGLDASGAMVRLAAARLSGAIVGDVRDLPIASQAVGGVVAFYSTIHLRKEDRVSTFRELRRALRPGGQLLVTAQEGEGRVRLRVPGAAGEVDRHVLGARRPCWRRSRRGLVRRARGAPPAIRM